MTYMRPSWKRWIGLRHVEQGCVVRSWWGVCWPEFETRRLVVAPIGLHLVYGAAREALYVFRRGFMNRDVERMRDRLERMQVRLSEIEARDLRWQLMGGSLDLVADTLDEAPRIGADVDDPEGSRWIQLSDTLARKCSENLRELAK